MHSVEHLIWNNLRVGEASSGDVLPNRNIDALSHTSSILRNASPLNQIRVDPGEQVNLDGNSKPFHGILGSGYPIVSSFAFLCTSACSVYHEAVEK
jgi:hypothetical protein